MQTSEYKVPRQPITTTSYTSKSGPASSKPLGPSGPSPISPSRSTPSTIKACLSLDCRRRPPLRLPPHRLIHIIEIHRHAQKPHVHVRLVRQIAQQDLQPRLEARPQLPQPLLQRGKLALNHPPAQVAFVIQR